MFHVSQCFSFHYTILSFPFIFVLFSFLWGPSSRWVWIYIMYAWVCGCWVCSCLLSWVASLSISHYLFNNLTSLFDYMNSYNSELRWLYDYICIYDEFLQFGIEMMMWLYIWWWIPAIRNWAMTFCIAVVQERLVTVGGRYPNGNIWGTGTGGSERPWRRWMRVKDSMWFFLTMSLRLLL